VPARVDERVSLLLFIRLFVLINLSYLDKLLASVTLDCMSMSVN
jgi:hypothetical protein